MNSHLSPSKVYGSSPIRERRTKADMQDIRDAILRLLTEDNPMTCRQVFYRLTGLGAVAKTEAQYKGTVVRLLGEMRLDGDIPFGWIADNTRWMRKPRSHSSLAQALQDTAQTYRRSLWRDLPTYVEIWLEKDALAGVLYEEAEKWDVPLMVTRGYASLSYLHEAALAIAAQKKAAHIFYFGDFDPSGLDIPRKVEARLREFAPRASIHFERVAVTSEQIADLHLPSRPTKVSDSRSKGFADQSVEVDSIPSSILRGLAATCIAKHIDSDVLDRVEETEELERETLASIALMGWQPGAQYYMPGSGATE